MFGWLNVAAANPVITHSIGWSPTTWVSLFGSGGLIGTVLFGISRIQKNANDRAGAVDTRDAARDTARWTEVMGLVKTQAERIDVLEKALAEQTRQAAFDLAEERKRNATAEAELRKDHAAEIAELRKELAGMYRMISSSNTAAARLFEPREDLPEDMKNRLRSLEQDGKRKLDRSGE